MALRVAASAAILGLALGDDQAKYDEWKTAYGSNGGEEEFQVFSSNLRVIEAMQANDPSATYSHMTPFANISPESFKTRNGYRATTGATPAPLLDVSNVASSYDWRDHGAVNAIKDQGQCGSCWAFSTVANVEGVGSVETGKLLNLSEQQLMDCDSADGSCNGGLPSNAFQFMIDHGMGLESESAYPYKAKDATCSKVASQEKAFITAWHQINTDETQIAAAVQQYGPLSIGINANTFQFYTGGVSDPLFCNPAALDHGVAIVGFGTDNGKDYWTIRNSWGTSWGEAGYIRMVRGKGACGLNTDATTATGVSTMRNTLPESNVTLKSSCVQPGSIPGGSCQNCKESAQCSSGFCCPYMKKCVSSSSQGCYLPIAKCQPTCFTASCTSCSPTDGSDYNSHWGSPTCSSEDVVV